MMLRFFKLSITIFLFFIFIGGALVLRFYAVTCINKRRISAWWTSKLSRAGLKLFGVETSAVNPDFLKGRGKLIISNHMSYLDILVYSAIKPSVFISSVEIQKTPFLGFVAAIGGTFFVERRDPKLIKMEIGKIAELVENGFNVYLFPEGTSTDGSKILPFRSSLLAAASGADVEVVPACIKYTELDGEDFSEKNCDFVCWYGDMSFAPHLWNLLSKDHIKVKTTFFEPMNSAVYDRKAITQKAHEVISKEFFSAA